MSSRTGVPPRLVLAMIVTAIGSAFVAGVQLRTGVVPMLDTVTYWSGIRATADGHPFTTTLAPSFSNFDVVEVLERAGRLPFVDFPLGYPIVGGLIAVVIGAEPAMIALAIAASLVIGIMVVIGPNSVSDPWALVARVIAGITILLLPAQRLVTQAALSEPLFTAAALSLAVVMFRYRQGRAPWWAVVCLVISAGLLRFIGAPLAVIAGLERYRRDGRIGRACVWTLGMMMPAIANIVWASWSGGGHSAGWRGLDHEDVDVFVRSVGGWWEASQGDLRLTYFGGLGPAWWAWPLTVVWIVGVTLAIAGVLVGAHDTHRRDDHGRRRWRLPASIEITWAMAGVITTGLVLGMLGFDALVIADNRLMLPAGVLTITGIVWWATEWLDRHTGAWRARVVAFAALAVWIGVAAEPTAMTDVFSDQAPERGDIAEVAATNPGVVIANDADGVHWATGIPAAYAPLPTKALTGEDVDVAAIYASLPCPLLRADGVVVLADNALFGAGGRTLLDGLVDDGRLERTSFPGGVLYEAADGACS